MHKYRIEFAITGMVTHRYRDGPENTSETIEMTQQGRGKVIFYGPKPEIADVEARVRDELYKQHWTRYDGGKLKGILKLVIFEVEMEIEIDTYRLEPLTK